MKFGLRYCNTGRYVDPGKAIVEVGKGRAQCLVNHGGKPRWR